MSWIQRIFGRPKAAITPCLGKIEVDADWIRFHHPKGEIQQIRWDELDEVGIVTTDEGPFVEDVLPTFISDQKPAYVAHPYAEQQMPHAIQHSCCLIVGPEGGFIPYEVDLLKKNGCQAMSLGNRILRTETAVSHILGRLFI